MALSLITNYRLSDWLAAFGFDLEALWRVQFLFRRSATTLLNSEIFDPLLQIPWFRDRFRSVQSSDIAPLGAMLAPLVGAPATLLSDPKRGFLYARIGEQDPYAIPSFAPGTIIRVNARHPKLAKMTADSPTETADFFLTEYDRGWTCSRLTLLGGGRVSLRCPFEGFLERELRLGRDAKILGLVDAEIRPITGLRYARRCQGPSSKAAEQMQTLSARSNIGELLRKQRIKLGLSFREASSMSRRIAEYLGDVRYFAAAGTLSDFETLATAPHHLEKILTLCALFCIDFQEFLRACNLPVDQVGRESVPHELLSGQKSQKQQLKGEPAKHIDSANGFIKQLRERWKDIPFFLKDSLDSITGIKNFSYRDAFWVGGGPRPRHPLLTNAEFVAVNRRSKKPPPPNKAGCQPPLYVLLIRDGNYLCGPCSLDETHLCLSGCSKDAISPARFRNAVEAEVIGEVTAILRRID